MLCASHPFILTNLKIIFSKDRLREREYSSPCHIARPQKPDLNMLYALKVTDSASPPLPRNLSEISLPSLPAVLEILAGRVALGVQEGHSLLVVLGDPSGQYDPCGLGFQGLQAGPFLLVILCHLWFQGLPKQERRIPSSRYVLETDLDTQGEPKVPSSFCWAPGRGGGGGSQY